MYCGLSAPKLRAVRGSTRQTPPEPPMFLENFLYWLADCPLSLSGLSAIHLRQTTRHNGVSGQISNPIGGPSAVHSSNPPETTTSLDKILDSTADCPLSNSGPSAAQSCEPHQRHRLWTNFKFQRRTVRSPIADRPQFDSVKPPETTSSLDKI